MDQKEEHLVDRICQSLNITAADLARELKITKSAISDWKKKPVIPVVHCKYLEERLKDSSTPITCMDMRPKDWRKYWPELAAQEQNNS